MQICPILLPDEKCADVASGTCSERDEPNVAQPIDEPTAAGSVSPEAVVPEGGNGIADVGQGIVIQHNARVRMVNVVPRLGANQLLGVERGCATLEDLEFLFAVRGHRGAVVEVVHGLRLQDLCERALRELLVVSGTREKLPLSMSNVRKRFAGCLPRRSAQLAQDHL